jgi:AcrR family transcriptional regulator
MTKKSPITQGKTFDQTVVKSRVTDVALVQRRRAQIVDAAILLFSTQGYYKTTMQQIARQAGVSIGLIYQYAQTKDDILLLSLMNVMETYKHELPKSSVDGGEPLQQLWAAIETYCRVVNDRREAAVLAYRSTMSLPRHYRDYIKQVEVETNEFISIRLRACISAGLFREVNVELVTYQIVLYAHTWALKYWRLSQFVDLDEYLEQGFDFFVRAMATRKGTLHFRRFLEARKTKPAIKRKSRPAT